MPYNSCCVHRTMVSNIKTMKIRAMYLSLRDSDSAYLDAPWNLYGIMFPMLPKRFWCAEHSIIKAQSSMWHSHHSHDLLNGFINLRNEVFSTIDQLLVGSMDFYRTWMKFEISPWNSKWQSCSYTQAWWFWTPRSQYSATSLLKRQGRSQELSVDMRNDKVTSGGMGRR